jgi:Flp pilus assembly protein TadG
MKRQPKIDRLFALRRRRRERHRPRGVIVVLTGFCLVAVFAFVALSVDTSRIALTETRMQNAVDAAALAAAEEITAAVYQAGGDGSNPNSANSAAIAAARQMAADVAAANGVFVDAQLDVSFGKRSFDEASGEWPIAWGATPYNTVRVRARRTNEDIAANDGQLPLAFGWAVGRSQVPLQTTATAFVEARDLVMVLDFSGSMNYDSQLTSSLGVSAAEELLDNMWDTLVAADPKWPSTATSKFTSGGFGQINSYAGTYISSTDTATIRSQLGLTANVNGNRQFPYPQAGRYSDGSPKPKPGNSTSDALWGKYIDFVKNHPVSSYRKKYGYRTLMDFMQQKTTNGFTPRDRYTSEDMWRTPHYPMEGVKKGASLFLDFLAELDFGDEVGLVGYGEWAEPIALFHDGDVTYDLSGNPITAEYELIDDLQLRHQAGEFNGQTAMGDGIRKGREMLVGPNGNDGYVRHGTRPTMLLMTDGITNQKPSTWTLPASFKWSDWTDYDGDGDADYSSSDNYKRYAFYEATQAIKKGIVIHTLSVGADADSDLMKAIAFAGGGVYMEVPGDGVASMEAGLLNAFAQIAGKVPPAKLVFDE